LWAIVATVGVLVLRLSIQSLSYLNVILRITYYEYTLSLLPGERTDENLTFTKDMEEIAVSKSRNK